MNSGVNHRCSAFLRPLLHRGEEQEASGRTCQAAAPAPGQVTVTSRHVASALGARAVPGDLNPGGEVVPAVASWMGTPLTLISHTVRKQARTGGTAVTCGIFIVFLVG